MQAPKMVCYRWSPSHLELTFKSTHLRHTVRIAVAVPDLGTEGRVTFGLRSLILDRPSLWGLGYWYYGE